MKKTKHLAACVAALLFLGAAPLEHATAQTSEEYPIAGIWQAAAPIIDGGKMKVVYVPIFKILGEDGSMCNLNASGNAALLTQQGTYVMTSDSTYTEMLNPSALNDGKGGKGLMKYKLKSGGKIMEAWWFNDESGQWQPEFYRKVELPLQK